MEVIAGREFSERRKLGAFYTPERLSQIMADWAIRLPSDEVLEPSFGGCGFLAAARDALARRGAANPSHHIYGCDVDPVAFAYLASVLGSPTDTTGFLLEDFLDVVAPPQWPAKFSVVLGNPPYIPHHRIGRERVRELAKRHLPLTGTGGRSSLWAYFVSHSISMLAPGGRMAWVLPGAFLQADYAAPLRKFLGERFEKAIAFIVRERLFLSEGTDEESVILLADNFLETRHDGQIELSEVQSLDGLSERLACWSAGNWSGHKQHGSPASLSMTGPAAAVFERLAAHKSTLPFGQLAKVQIGLVTGANDFFVLKRSELDAAGLKEEDCLPVVPKFRACAGLTFERQDIDDYLASDARALLVTSAGGPTSARLDAYLATFDEARKAKVGTFRKRAIWSKTVDDKVPDAFFPVMHHTGPRLVLNTLGSHCTNTLHRVLFAENTAPPKRRLASLSLMSTFSQISAELVGRRYGSGVLKHEPRDAERILLLMPEIDPAESDEAFDRADRLLRSTGPVAARAAADEFLFGHAGMEAAEITATLDAALHDMRARRRPDRTTPGRS